jgi:hypothetical protein
MSNPSRKPRNLASDPSPRAWLELFRGDLPPTEGSGDILSIGPDPGLNRATSFVTAILPLTHSGGKRAFRQACILIPPVLDQADGDPCPSLRQQIETKIAELWPRQLSGTEREFLSNAVLLRRTPILESDSLLRELQALPSGTAVIVPDAALYRTSRVRVSQPMTLSEDRWAEHVALVAKSSVAIAKTNHLYVVLDTCEFYPRRESNIALVTSVDDCGVIAAVREDEQNHKIVSLLETWNGRLNAGTLGAFISAIDLIPGLSPRRRLLLTAFGLNRGGQTRYAFSLLQPTFETIRLDADVDGKLMLAEIAHDAGADTEAEGLLQEIQPLLRHEEQFRSALRIARGASPLGTAPMLAARMEQLFPNSVSLSRYRVLAAMDKRDYETAVKAIDTFAQHGELDREFQFYRVLAQDLAKVHELGYAQLKSEVELHYSSFRNSALLFFAREAVARGDLQNAIEHASVVELDSRFASGAAGVLLQILSSRLLEPNPAGVERPDDDHIVTTIEALVRYLGANPGDDVCRVRLARLLSAERSGSRGPLLLALICLKLAQTPMRISWQGINRDSPDMTDEFQRFLDEAHKGIGVYPQIIGLGELPREISQEEADSFLRQLTWFLHEAVKDWDIAILLGLLHFGMLLARRSSTPNEDLVLLRFVAGHMALRGQTQKARDLVEHALQAASSNETPMRRRLAWMAFGDAYHLVHNLPEALLGIAACLSQGAEILPDEGWHELLLLIRILRDLGMLDLASQLLPTARELAQQAGFSASGQLRMDTMELGIRFKSLLGADTAPEDGSWRELLTLIAKNCRDVVDANIETGPAAVLLGQTIRCAVSEGVSVDDSVHSALSLALDRLPSGSAARIRAIAEIKPTARAIEDFLGGIELVHFADDVGTDLRPVTMLAGRLLASDDAVAFPEIGAFASEILTDHSFDQQGAATLTAGAPMLKTVDEVARALRAASTGDRTIHMIALDSKQRLARTTAERGRILPVVYETPEVFSIDSFELWKEKYPYGYADTDSLIAVTSNEMRVSMMSLGLSHTPSQSIVVVPSVPLQRLPANLLFIDDDFAGAQVPVATIPSLSWLRQIRSVPRTRSHRRVAWIPNEHSPENAGTLEQIAERVAPALDDFDIVLATATDHPDRMQGADLAVIAAHGSLDAEGRFFRAVSDESTLRLPPRQLAQMVEGCALVVLFVCSGGRSDPVPFSSSVVGLAKLVLNAGCRAVLASPWPLDARVPPHWLPAFLLASSRGTACSEANFQANKAVAKGLGDLPNRCLAMHLFGDPDFLPNEWLLP